MGKYWKSPPWLKRLWTFDSALADEAEKYIDGIKSKHAWIPCAERLPEIPEGAHQVEVDVWYFLAGSKKGVQSALYNRRGEFVGQLDYDAKGWKYRPSPPESEYE
jgi:hypothetical protein